MPESQKPTLSFRIFSHLTNEERLDKACELLALGVLRLAEKRGLLKRNEKPYTIKEKRDEKTVLFRERKSAVMV